MPAISKLGDRDAGQAAEQDGQRGGRNQHGDRAGRHDRSHGDGRVIAALEHVGQERAAEHGGIGDGRAREGGEHGAAGDRDDREPARASSRDQPVDRVDRQEGDARMEQDLAHEQKQRDRRQREIR